MFEQVIWKTTELNISDPQFFMDWERLSNQYHGNNQLLSADFLSLLLKYFKNEPLYCVKAISADQTICMMVVRQKNRIIWELFKPSQAQVGLMIAAPKFKPELSSLFKSLPGLAVRLDFMSLDPHEHLSFINSLNQSESERYATNMQVRISGTFESYWNNRSKNLRKNISRYENRLDKENKKLDFRIISTSEDILSAVDRYGIIESKGWKGKIGTALHPSNQQGQFYREFLHKLSLQNNAVVYELYIEDKLVASRLCCIKRNMLIILKTTFDEDYKQFALGRLLLKRILETLFHSQATDTIDFYTNASPEQLDWSTDSRPMYNNSHYANSIFSHTIKCLATIKQKLTSNFSGGSK